MQGPKLYEISEKLTEVTTPTSKKDSQKIVPARQQAVRFLPQIRDFRLNSNIPLRMLDTVGWLFYRLFVIFILLAKFITLSTRKAEKPITPPGPEGHSLLGVYPEFAEKGLLDFSDQIWKTYGQQTGICQFKLGSRHVYLVTEPSYNEKILSDTDTFARGNSFETIRHFLGNTSITTEGEIWKQKSRELSPHLVPKKLKLYHNCIVEVGQATHKRWLSYVQQGQPISDLLEEMSLVTVDVIGRSLLNMDLHHEMASTGKALNHVLSYIIKNFISVVPPWILEKLPTQSTQEYKQALQTLKRELNQAITKYIAEKCSTGEYYIDERIEAYRDELDKGIISKALIDEIMVVFFAGHDTTSKLLTWTLFELSQNPKVSQRLYEEIDIVLQERAPTLDNLKELPYLTKVLQEALRMYPPVSGIVRDVTQDTQLGPYCIEKGSSVQIGIRLMSKDPKIWNKPEEFNPDRFEGELTNKVGQYIFTPFIAGKHRCPGQHLALMEAKIILITLMQQFGFQLVNQESIHAITKVTLHPDKPIKLSLVMRPSTRYTFPLNEKAEVNKQEQEIRLEKLLANDMTLSHAQMESTTGGVTLSNYSNIAFIGRPSQTALQPRVPAKKTGNETLDSQYESQFKLDKM